MVWSLVPCPFESATKYINKKAAFVFVLGQIGGSIFPAITGVIATQCGVQVLQPMLVGLFGAAAISWLFLPKDKEPLDRD